MNILSLLTKIDLKTGLAAAVVMVAVAYAVLERIRRVDAEKDRREAVLDRQGAERARMEADAVALAWQDSYLKCKSSLQTLQRIAREESDAARRRVAALRKQVNKITVETKEGEYALKDVVNDARKWQ